MRVVYEHKEWEDVRVLLISGSCIVGMGMLGSVLDVFGGSWREGLDVGRQM